MPKALHARVLLCAGLLLLVVRAQAQDPAVYAFQPESKLWIEGTSNKSDWTVNATVLAGNVSLKNPAAASGPGVEKVRLVVPSAKILSGKSTIMDRLMHKTLQVEEHPEIVYELTSAEAGANALALLTHGRLTLAGVTKNVDVPVQGQQLADGKMRFTGSHTLLMTDYGMKPPTAMFGALHTGDEVVVHFDLVAAARK